MPNRRYQILRTIGQGGMSVVHQAVDRLTGNRVALKQMLLPLDKLMFASRLTLDSDVSDEMALAHEFQTLASLRHPNIVSVLDYGFDAQHRPYFTMELLTNARILTQAAQHRPYADKVNLLIQVLRALLYLHRRSILYRDLKPDNVLVVEGQVKMVDFGLAAAPGTAGVSGTLAYMAPEVLSGGAATVASDLYAFGMIAYELFAGVHPFHLESVSELIEETFHVMPDVLALDIDSGMTHILARLLSKDPEDRYPSSDALLAALQAEMDMPLEIETSATREGFLQAAPFTGREKELALLKGQMKRLQQGSGSAILIAGESGIGKSRLLAELRTYALVQGIPVLQGQAINDSRIPYQLWDEPLRWITMLADAAPQEVSLLQQIVPHISLSADPLPDLPPLEPRALQERVIATVIDLIRRAQTPLILMMEDLQWADEGSLTLLAHLVEAAPQLSMAIYATYRSDERPKLPQLFPAAAHLRLERLDKQATADLLDTMVGGHITQPQLVEFLYHETQGNAFFLVELVRTLAERTGNLDQIDRSVVPTSLSTLGIEQILQRRLALLNEADQNLLRYAAVIGRVMDFQTLEACFPQADIEPWLIRCSDLAILDVNRQQWWFAHDKLRENLLNQLAPDIRQQMHRQVAEAMEQVYASDIARAAVLAYHWRMAQDWQKTAYYALLAGQNAMQLFSFAEARQAFNDALFSLEQLEQTDMVLQRRLDLLLKLVNVSLVADSPQQNLRRLETAQQITQQLFARYRDDDILYNVHYAMGRAHYYYTQPEPSMMHFQQMRIAAQNLGREDLISVATGMIGRVLSLQGYFRDALPLLDETIKPLERAKNWSDLLWNLGYRGFCTAVCGDEQAGIAQGEAALRGAEQLKHRSALPVMHIFLTMSHWQAGRLDAAVQAAEATIRTAQAAGEKMPLHLGHGFGAWALMRLGDIAAARDHLQQYDAFVEQMGGRLVYADWFAAMKAEFALLTQPPEQALQIAEAAAQFADSVGGIFASGLARRAWAVAAEHLGQTALSRELLGKSLALFERGGAHFEIARTRQLQG